MTHCVKLYLKHLLNDKNHLRNHEYWVVSRVNKVQDLFAMGHNIDGDNMTNSGDRKLTVLKRRGSAGISGEVVRRMRATAVAVG